LYAVRLKCAEVCVVKVCWQIVRDGVGGVGENVWWTLDTLDKDRCVDFLFGIKLFLGCAAITLCAFLFSYRSILLVGIDCVLLVRMNFFFCVGGSWLVGLFA
jgi:hypothetical protein